MPKFHSKAFNGIDASDEEGIVRPSLEVARSEVVSGARDLIANPIRYGKQFHRTDRIEIRNEAGILQDTVNFGDVIDLRP